MDIFKAEEVLITLILLRLLFAAQISLLCFFSTNKFRTDWGRAALTSNSFASIYFKSRSKKNKNSLLHSDKPQVLTDIRNHTKTSLGKAYSIYLSI